MIWSLFLGVSLKHYWHVWYQYVVMRMPSCSCADLETFSTENETDRCYIFNDWCNFRDHTMPLYKQKQPSCLKRAMETPAGTIDCIQKMNLGHCDVTSWLKKFRVMWWISLETKRHYTFTVLVNHTSLLTLMEIIIYTINMIF